MRNLTLVENFSSGKTRDGIIKKTSRINTSNDSILFISWFLRNEPMIKQKNPIPLPARNGVLFSLGHRPPSRLRVNGYSVEGDELKGIIPNLGDLSRDSKLGGEEGGGRGNGPLTFKCYFPRSSYFKGKIELN